MVCGTKNQWPSPLVTEKTADTKLRENSRQPFAGRRETIHPKIQHAVGKR
jgi:hypothetical protein